MGKLIRSEIPINNDFRGEDPKKEPKKAKTTFLPIQLNTSNQGVNNSVYHTKILMLINADHCSIINQRPLRCKIRKKRERFGPKTAQNVLFQ